MFNKSNYHVCFERNEQYANYEEGGRMIQAKQIPHRHHYLPQFYLRGFSGHNKQVCVYDKTNDVDAFSYRYPKSIGFEKDLYELLVVEGADPMMIEIELG